MKWFGLLPIVLIISCNSGVIEQEYNNGNFEDSTFVLGAERDNKGNLIMHRKSSRASNIRYGNSFDENLFYEYKDSLCTEKIYVFNPNYITQYSKVKLNSDSLKMGDTLKVILIIDDPNLIKSLKVNDANIDKRDFSKGRFEYKIVASKKGFNVVKGEIMLEASNEKFEYTYLVE